MQALPFSNASPGLSGVSVISAARLTVTVRNVHVCDVYCFACRLSRRQSAWLSHRRAPPEHAQGPGMASNGRRRATDGLAPAPKLSAPQRWAQSPAQSPATGSNGCRHVSDVFAPASVSTLLLLNILLQKVSLSKAPRHLAEGRAFLVRQVFIIHMRLLHGAALHQFIDLYCDSWCPLLQTLWWHRCASPEVRRRGVMCSFAYCVSVWVAGATQKALPSVCLKLQPVSRQPRECMLLSKGCMMLSSLHEMPGLPVDEAPIPGDVYSTVPES